MPDSPQGWYLTDDAHRSEIRNSAWIRSGAALPHPSQRLLKTRGINRRDEGTGELWGLDGLSCSGK